MRRRGFTLIELLIVILLLSIVAAVATPRLRSALPATRVRSAGRVLASDLRYLYAYAVARREHVRLAIDLSEGTYWAETFRVNVRDDDRPRVLSLQLRTDFSLGAESRQADVREAKELRDALAGRRELPPGVQFVEVRIAGGFVERSGTVYIEFTPWGYGDDADVVLAAGEDLRTVRLIGLLGEATVLGVDS